MRTQENEGPQRQAAPVPGQISDDAVAEWFPAEALPAAEEHKQTNQVDRQPPGELQQIEENPSPARGGNWRTDAMLRLGER